MTKSPARNLGLIAIVLVLGAFVGAYFYKKTNDPVLNPMPGVTLREELVRPDSHAQGPENAPLTIVEFLDPECESCKAFFPIMKEFLKENPQKIRFVVRYMAFHSSSSLAIAALESAALQEKYWEYLELLFTKADEWGHQASPDSKFFEKYATEMGLNLEKFKSDMADPKWQELIARDSKDGQIMGVKGTPTVFLNGDMFRSLDISGLREAARPFFEVQK